MPSKKPAAARKAAVKPKAVQTSKAIPTTETPQTEPAQQGSFFRVWTLPIALLMLVMSAGAFWLAVRESSNSPQAATPAAMREPETMAPVASRKVSSPTPTPTTAAPAKPGDTTIEPRDKPKAVSITGCLQKTDSGFLLKNTEGTDAPKSRSWKSGFIKHTNASIDLEDASSTRLASHVGEKVSVTGPLADRQMSVQSVHRVAATCQ